MDASFVVADIVNCSNSIITYVINGIATKLPLKEKDICATINVKGKLFNTALQHARQGLRETYGILLVDIPDSKTGKAYIACNEDTGKSYLFSVSSHQKNTSEDDLVNFLAGLRIHFDACHEYFGPNVKKLVTETFVKQLYLKREKIISDLETEIKFYYSWGFRAHTEFNKKLLLEATAKILKKPASYFVAKYQEVCQNENNDTET